MFSLLIFSMGYIAYRDHEWAGGVLLWDGIVILILTWKVLRWISRLFL
ncbi:MAG: hypothetical protein NVV63_02465 [Opitutus sp.]|nr:hypothetical protein [Opitutus sp.]